MSVQRADLALAKAEWQMGQGQEYEDLTKDIQRQLFEQGVTWREQDLATQGLRAGVQYQWQQQDFAWQRNSFELQQGWKTEDIDEAIRYASGRQRIKLMEQRERMTHMANLQRGRMEEQEGRAATQYGWKQEDIEKARQRLGEEVELRRKLFDIDEERVETQKEFAKQELELLRQERDHAQQKLEELDEVHEKQNRQVEISRQGQDIDRKYREERYAADKAYYDEMTPRQKEYWDLTRQMQTAMQAQWVLQNKGVREFGEYVAQNFGKGGRVYNAWRDFLALQGSTDGALGTILDQMFGSMLP
jgi:hypothetical protein